MSEYTHVFYGTFFLIAGTPCIVGRYEPGGCPEGHEVLIRSIPNGAVCAAKVPWVEAHAP